MVPYRLSWRVASVTKMCTIGSLSNSARLALSVLASKVKKQYRRVKDKRNKTGEGRFPEWDYFDAMDGHRPATQPPVLVNSTDGPGDVASETTGTESQQEERESPELEDIQSGATESSSATSRSTTPLPTQRKRKRSKGEKMDSST